MLAQPDEPRYAHLAESLRKRYRVDGIKVLPFFPSPLIGPPSALSMGPSGWRRLWQAGRAISVRAAKKQMKYFMGTMGLGLAIQE
jgi:hypothetical protein